MIIAVDRSRQLPLATFQAALFSATRRNPHGLGLAWPDEGRLRIRKHASVYAPILEQASALYGGTELPFVVHLRYSTVGPATGANTHPFALSPSLAMVHNKTLAIEPPHSHWSDSRTVAELLKTLIAGDPAFYRSPLFWSFIEHQAGADNRLVFLEAQEQELLIINEQLGSRIDGLWFSNLYAWDPGTVGLPRRPASITSRIDDHVYAEWSDRSGAGAGGCDPLVRRSARLDRRELDAPRGRGGRRAARAIGASA